MQFSHELPHISLFMSIIFSSLILLVVKIRNNTTIFMPKEFKTIKRIIEKISQRNNLGEYPLTFTIIAGSRTYWIARALGVCKKEDFCYFMRNINPFLPYKGKFSEEINEAIRQSYLINSIEAYAWPNGTIAISRSTFRTNKSREDYIAFILGHEISHILNNDSFNNSLKKAKKGKGLKPKKKEEIGYRFSRESESKADINSAKMLLKAGYSKDIPIKAHDFFSKQNGYAYETEKNSSHPGYEDRRKNIKDFLTDYEASEKAFLRKECTKGRWIFSRKENTLTFKIFS